MRSAFIAAAFAAASCLALPAGAACFEDIGCSDTMIFAEEDLERLSCDTLWTVRNTIFHENGYCFRTPRGRAAFSNEGCRTSNAEAIVLNRYERENVNAVRRVEQRLCAGESGRPYGRAPGDGRTPPADAGPTGPVSRGGTAASEL